MGSRAVDFMDRKVGKTYTDKVVMIYSDFEDFKPEELAKRLENMPGNPAQLWMVPGRLPEGFTKIEGKRVVVREGVVDIADAIRAAKDMKRFITKQGR